MPRIKKWGNKMMCRLVNWIIGNVLLVLTLALSYSGYLLPWDQLAYWALVIGANVAKSTPVIGDTVRELLIGGNEIGQSGLLRFYILHCVVLPVFLTIGFFKNLCKAGSEQFFLRQTCQLYSYRICIYNASICRNLHDAFIHAVKHDLKMLPDRQKL